jgi:hypothetical protein
MKKYFLSAIVLSLASISFFAACKKEPTASKTTCAATLYGYNYLDTIFAAPSSPVGWGAINETPLATTSVATLPVTAYSNQGAYNASDNSYYVFQFVSSGITNTLIKVGPGGVVTTYTGPGAQHLEGLVHNRVTNKMYCLRYASGGSSATPADVVEIATSGTSFSVTPVGTTIKNIRWASPATSSVNNTSGEMYFAFADAPVDIYSIEKYTPGSGTSTVVSSGSGRSVMGVRFNSTDNMLYAITSEYPAGGPAVFKYVRIAPTSGVFTTLATLSFNVNNELYSTALDPCSNRYIVSTVTGTGWTIKTVKQFNMSGTIVQSDVTAGLFQGLTVND